MPFVPGLSDAMSDALALVRMQGEFVSLNAYTAPWSLSFEEPVVHFHVVERGRCWLKADGAELDLAEGDVVVVTRGTGHVLASDPALDPVPIETALGSAVQDGFLYRLGGDGPGTRLICGQFGFAGPSAARLLSAMPPVIHVRARDSEPLGWLRVTTHFLIEEIRRPGQGSAIMVSRLLDLLFIQALRHWGGRGPHRLDWLSGLRDPQIGKALSAIHDRPAEAWTVARLAAAAGLSRSAFAARFTEVVGSAPQRYLASWRLTLAAEHLKASSVRIGEIAALVGYGSEAALTRAFKAQFGATPGIYRSKSGGRSLNR